MWEWWELPGLLPVEGHSVHMLFGLLGVVTVFARMFLGLVCVSFPRLTVSVAFPFGARQCASAGRQKICENKKWTLE